MRIFARTLAIGFALIMAGSALAAPPGDVTNLKAVEKSGQIYVTWKAPAKEKIAKYRIYYNTASIIENGGDYIDYEETKGAETEWTLQDPALTGKIFVAVLAVNEKDEETEFFTEEASAELQPKKEPAPVQVPQQEAKSSVSSPIVAAPLADRTITMLRAEAVSATGVRLTFDHLVLIYPEEANIAFGIVDASGAALAIERLEVSGTEVIVHTMPQARGMRYRIGASRAVHGTMNGPGPQPLLTVGEPGSIQEFVGHEGGIVAGTTIEKLTLKPTKLPTGSYAIDVTWNMQGGGDIVSYMVSQSRDGGKTFGVSQEIAAPALSVRVEGVPPGSFGVSLQGKKTDGSLTQGVFQSIDLPGPAALSSASSQESKSASAKAAAMSSIAASSTRALPSKNVTASVQSEAREPLTQTGVALPLAVGVAGALAGYGVLCTKRKEA